MCGRYVSVQADSDLLAEFEALDSTEDAVADTGYNVAPTEAVRVVVNRRLRTGDGSAEGPARRQLRVVTWGLVPSWAKDRSTGAKMINARAESVATKPAFRKAFGRRRCLVPADGWYEWRKVEGRHGRPDRQPFFMTPVDGHGIAFAGVYEFWTPPVDPDADRPPALTTAAIITSPSVGALAQVHDRMPLVLARENWERWLDPKVEEPSDLLEPWDEARLEQIELRPVSSRVNSVRNQGAELVEPADVDRAPAPQRLF